jgi:hypothetical protein
MNLLTLLKHDLGTPTEIFATSGNILRANSPET